MITAEMSEPYEDDHHLPCGCYEYHMADCPLITDRFGSDEPEPYEPDGLDRDYEPGEAPWESDEREAWQH